METTHFQNGTIQKNFMQMDNYCHNGCCARHVNGSALSRHKSGDHRICAFWIQITFS